MSKDCFPKTQNVILKEKDAKQIFKNKETRKPQVLSYWLHVKVCNSLKFKVTENAFAVLQHWHIVYNCWKKSSNNIKLLLMKIQDYQIGILIGVISQNFRKLFQTYSQYTK